MLHAALMRRHQATYKCGGGDMRIERGSQGDGGTAGSKGTAHVHRAWVTWEQGKGWSVLTIHAVRRYELSM